MKHTRILAIVLAFVSLFASANIASAADCRVTKTADTNDGSCTAGDCSLREAVANPACPIVDFSLDIAGQPIVLTLGEIVINRSVTIKGWGADATLISGNNASRIFYSLGGTDVVISGVTLTGGKAPVNGPQPGGAAVYASGGMVLDGVYVTGNQNGALVLSNYGQKLINSTVAGNDNGSYTSTMRTIDLRIYNSTICNNSSSSVWSDDYPRAVNSTIVNNGQYGLYVPQTGTFESSNSVIRDIYVDDTFSMFISTGYSILSFLPGSYRTIYGPTDRLDIDPHLMPLGYYGGHMPTMMPIPGGASVDGANNQIAINAGLTTDQRGYSRFVDGDGNGTATADNGAVEFGATPPPPVRVAGRVLGAVSGNPLRSQTVTIRDMLGNTHTALSSSLGWFVFDDLPAGFVYRVSVNARRGSVSKTIFGDQDLTDADILVPGL
jgi:CSLREA domain-containing protein